MDAIIARVKIDGPFEETSRNLAAALAPWKARVIPILEAKLKSHVEENEPELDTELDDDPVAQRKKLGEEKKRFAEVIMSTLFIFGLAIGYEVNGQLLPHRLATTKVNKSYPKATYYIQLAGAKNPTISSVTLGAADFFSPLRLVDATNIFLNRESIVIEERQHNNSNVRQR